MINIYSKTELSKEIKDLITSKFNEAEVQFLIDEGILSGIRIENDSEIIDLTLNARINEIVNLLS